MSILQRKYLPLLAFGFLANFLTGPGQTYFISLFTLNIQQETGLNSSVLAIIYASATLLSAFSLPFMGRLIDRKSLFSMAIFSLTGISIGCLTMSMAKTVPLIFLGFFLMRFFGQGTTSLIGRTTIARTFTNIRGKALSVTGLGFPAAESVMPLLANILLASVGWRKTWLIFGSMTLAIAMPLMIYVLLLVEKHAKRNIDETEANEVSAAKHPVVHWQAKDVLRDIRFRLLLIPSLYPPFIVTALFFHHGTLVQAKGWSMDLIAIGMSLFAICHAGAALLIGPLIDKFSAAKLMHWHLLPIIVGIAAMAFSDSPWVAYFYLACGGLTIGLGVTIKPALWPELYGTKHLGIINSMMASAMVFSTALGPIIMGFILDAGIAHKQIYIASAALGIVSMILIFPALSRHLQQQTKQAFSV